MRALLCLLLVFALLPTHAREPAPEDLRAWQAYHLAVAETPGDAHSDFLMAQTLQLLARSHAASGDGDAAPELTARTEVIVAGLLARVDAGRDTHPALLAADLGCRPDPKATLCSERRARLETHAADNAYYGVILMANAWLAEDAEAYLRAARLSAAAERYDSLVAVPFEALRKRYRSVPVPALPGQNENARQWVPDGTAILVAHVFGLPPQQHFVQPCRESEGELRDHCLSIAKAMLVQSQVVMEIRIARSLVEALGAAEDIERARLIQRDAEWLLSRSAPLLGASDWGDVAGMQDYFDAYANDGELSAMRALLTAHGIATTPPTDWTEDSERPAGAP